MTDTALIVHPVLPGTSPDRSAENQMDEACSLVRAISLEVAGTQAVRLNKINPGMFFGSGVVEHIRELAEELGPSVVIVNGPLSPAQQRNLERAWQNKVIDRTGLILEIFGERAQTREGVLQVELARLDYQRSRLVRSWTHLERQRGGAGFMGGPGETQLEIDRRMITDRIARLKKELEDVRRTRNLARRSREQVPFPVVALVGYTNAGKSTLFNRLTGAGVFAKDLLFATLDPTMRRIDLPGGQPVILSDTVGFITDLPTHLIAAFRATLEQVGYADVILHVRDMSRPDREAQKKDVISIMNDLGIEYENDERIIEVLNKTDVADDEACGEIARACRMGGGRIVAVSALTGEGEGGLLAAIAAHVGRNRKRVTYDIAAADGWALSWLYDHAEITARSDRGDIVRLSVTIEPVNMQRFENAFPYRANIYKP